NFIDKMARDRALTQCCCLRSQHNAPIPSEFKLNVSPYGSKHIIAFAFCYTELTLTNVSSA
ncbi:hypothetical protein, partial [Leptospira alexanderi]|uniref:hypothetical protein n=1 Tax=Leptospira alexanderi TaxID=100053 RepID=UPI001BB0D16E